MLPEEVVSKHRIARGEGMISSPLSRFLPTMEAHRKCQIICLRNRSADIGITPMHVAVINSDLNAITELSQIPNSPGVNTLDVIGFSPLAYALMIATPSTKNIITTLIDLGGDINQALNRIKSHDSKMTSKWMRGMSFNNIMHIAHHIHPDFDYGFHKSLINAMLYERAPIDELRVVGLIDNSNRDVANDDGDTPLHLACQGGNFRIISSLLEIVPDVRIVNKNGDNIIHKAVPNKPYRLRTLLDSLTESNLEMTDEKNYDGLTPMDLLIGTGDDCKLTNVENFRLMIEYGAVAGCPDFSGVDDSKISRIQRWLISATALASTQHLECGIDSHLFYLGVCLYEIADLLFPEPVC